MVTARDEVEDRLKGFDAGADDYVVKPFATSELLARTRAVLRRAGVTVETIQVDDLLVDPGAARVTRGGVEIDLTATELRLLVFLAENRDRVMSTLQILTQVWGYDDYADNLVQVHISALRRKIEAHGPRLIHTARGLGYVLRAPR
jgi:DNA-binding response OmpR family regulator